MADGSRAFLGRVGQAFWREDYATLEELVRELQENQERFSDGTWIEEALFGGLELASTAPDEHFEQAGARFDRWLAHYHISAAAAIAQAGYQINLAWHLRATRPLARLLADDGRRLSPPARAVSQFALAEERLRAFRIPRARSGAAPACACGGRRRSRDGRLGEPRELRSRAEVRGRCRRSARATAVTRWAFRLRAPREKACLAPVALSKLAAT